MILAHYCSRTVLQEQMDQIREHGSRLWPRNMLQIAIAYFSYFRIEASLAFYESYLSIRRLAGLPPIGKV